MISLIVGLGNPGAKYESTRHNAGFDFIEALISRYPASLQSAKRFFGEVADLQINGRRCWLLKPNTFMNLSGQAVQALAGYYQLLPEHILVAHDELDLPVGAVRLKKGGGHGGHNGLRDINQRLGSGDFLRLRIGIGHPGNKQDVVGYVLSNPSSAERLALDAAIDEAVAVIPQILAGELQKAMHELHSS